MTAVSGNTNRFNAPLSDEFTIPSDPAHYYSFFFNNNARIFYNPSLKALCIKIVIRPVGSRFGEIKKVTLSSFFRDAKSSLFFLKEKVIIFIPLDCEEVFLKIILQIFKAHELKFLPKFLFNQ